VIDDEIRLALPAAPDFARLARLTVAGLANRVGFTYDEVEDLRIAVGEMCQVLIGPDGRSGTLDLVFRITSEGLEVEATGRFELDGPIDHPSDLSVQILDAVVDEHEVLASAKTVRLRKRRAVR
jgi:hypothetical protein